MSNMSYCRFRNTEIDLEDCLNAIEYGAELSESEFDACKEMFEKFINFCIEHDIIEEDGELDERLEDFFNTVICRE